MKSIFIMQLAAFCAVLHSQEVWKWSDPQPQGNDLFAITCAGNRVVAAGSHGTIMTSTDCTNWTIAQSGTTHEFRAIDWTGSLFVAAGNHGVIATSPDAITWSVSTYRDSVELRKVCNFKNSIYIVGDLGTIIRSNDGRQWASIFPDGTKDFNSVAASDSVIVAHTLFGALYTSVDGTSWILTRGEYLDGNPTIADIQWSGKEFIVGGVVRSIDGKTWTKPSTSFPTNGKIFAFSDSQFVTVESFGKIYTTKDFKTWTTVTCSLDVNFQGMTYGMNRFFATALGGVILYSFDAMTWTRSGSGTWYDLKDVAWTGNQWVLVGNNILTSHDGIHWTKRNQYGGYIYFNAVAVSKDRIVTVGLDGAASISTDGVTWATTKTNTSDNLFGVAFWQNMFIAVGAMGTEVLFDSTGNLLESRKFPTNEHLGKIFATQSKLYIAADSQIFASSNAIDWTPLNIPSGKYLHAMAWSGTQFVVIGAKGLCSISSNGENWETISTGYDEYWEKICWTGGYFVATGENGGIIISKNGRNWTSVNSGTDHALYGVCSNDGMVVAVGSSGTIISSQKMSNNAIRANAAPGKKDFTVKSPKKIAVFNNAQPGFSAQVVQQNNIKIFDLKGRRMQCGVQRQSAYFLVK